MQQRGMALISALIFLMVMLLMVSSSLFISQLSLKSAQAAQQQLLLEQQGWQQHYSSLTTLDSDTELAGVQRLSACPASFAAWSGQYLDCEWLEFSTELHSEDSRLHLAFSSMLLRHQLKLEGISDADF
ncbi:hypothetical protein [Arsukibacterium sp.]|uniref:hypothetical protein n=1 Tax=Arsukibacterium sp. TaxID=1977258 RepID=UPI002FDAF2EB